MRFLPLKTMFFANISHQLSGGLCAMCIASSMWRVSWLFLCSVGALVSSVRDVLPWPGIDSVTTVDFYNEFEENLSGLFYEARDDGDVLWAVQNSPSTMFKLRWNGTYWVSTDQGWQNGKTLTYGDGKTHPDSEDVTLTSTRGEIYICAEQNNDNNDEESRLSILRYVDDPMTPKLRATHEWILNDDLPHVDDNLGLEAIAWIPDAFLVAQHLVDHNLNQLYNPSLYPNHGDGLFCVGLEANGEIYCYALDHVKLSYTRIIHIDTTSDVMSLHFDEASGYLWAVCDNTCRGDSTIFTIQDGIFCSLAVISRPDTMPNINNEGFGLSPRCVENYQNVYWSDDSSTNGYSIRHDNVPCGAFISE